MQRTLPWIGALGKIETFDLTTGALVTGDPETILRKHIASLDSEMRDAIGKLDAVKRYGFDTIVRAADKARHIEMLIDKAFHYHYLRDEASQQLAEILKSDAEQALAQFTLCEREALSAWEWRDYINFKTDGIW